LGGKWEEVKRNLLLLLALATKWGSSFTSFLLFKRAKLDHFGLFFSDIILISNLEKTCSHNLLG
jgi:alpha-N-acetylglucosamine transferase